MKKVLAIALALTAGTAFAGVNSANLQVSATVNAACNVADAALTFGVYDTLAAPQQDAQANITMTCTKGATPKVALGNGAHYLGGRRMVGGASGDFLSYELYSDSARQNVWTTALTPAGTTGTPAATRTATITMTIYGRIPAGTDVLADSYTDTVVATVTF